MIVKYFLFVIFYFCLVLLSDWFLYVIGCFLLFCSCFNINLIVDVEVLYVKIKGFDMFG